MGTRHSFHPIGEVVQQVARRFGLENKLLELHLRQHWPKIAGSQIAAHTKPDQVRFKKLYLVVESSVWAHQLTFLKPTLIENICAEAGRTCITDIVVRVGDVTDVAREKMEQDLDQAAPSIAPDVSPESLEQAAAHTQEVKDPDLQIQLTMIMAKALSLKKTPRK